MAKSTRISMHTTRFLLYVPESVDLEANAQLFLRALLSDNNGSIANDVELALTQELEYDSLYSCEVTTLPNMSIQYYYIIRNGDEKSSLQTQPKSTSTSEEDNFDIFWYPQEHFVRLKHFLYNDSSPMRSMLQKILDDFFGLKNPPSYVSILRRYQRLQQCITEWGKLTQGYFQFEPDSFHSIAANFFDVTASQTTVGDHALAICCLIGSLDSENRELLCIENALDITQILIAECIHLNSIQQKGHLPQYTVWLEQGLMLLILRLKTKDKYLWLGVTPLFHNQVNIDTRIFDGSPENWRVALAYFRKNVLHKEKSQEYNQVLPAMIRFAPSVNVLCEALKGESAPSESENAQALIECIEKSDTRTESLAVQVAQLVSTHPPLASGQLMRDRKSVV